MRILFLTARLPYPPNRGDRLRAYHFLRVLSREHRITLLSFIDDSREAEHVAALRPFCEDIQLVRRAGWQGAAGAALGAWRPLPLQSLYYRSPVMRGAVDRLLGREAFDVVYVHLFRMAQYVADRFRPYRILDLTDAISGEVARALPYRDPFWRLVYRLELPRIERYERAMVRQFDETWVISEAERAAIAAAVGAGVGGDGRPPPNLRVVANGVETERYRPQLRPAGGAALVFVGHMGVFHNVDAAVRLAEGILPRVRAAVPGARLELIGTEPAARVGWVTWGAATKNQKNIPTKLFEYMAYGLPVVSSDLPSTRPFVPPDVGLLAGADDAAGHAAALLRLLGNGVTAEALGAAGRRRVGEAWNWAAMEGRLLGVYAAVLKEG